MKSVSNRIGVLRRKFTRHLCDSCVFHGSGVTPLFCDENKDTPHLHIHCVLQGFVHPVDECSNYRTSTEFKKEQKKLRAKRDLTHEGIVDLCRTYGLAQGWQETPAHIGHPEPDLAFLDGETTYVVEVKPKKASRDEIKKGIGQCAFYLLYGYKPYLVVYDIYEENLSEIIVTLFHFGLIIYNSQGELRVVYHA